MADFKTQVEDLIGTVGDDALISQSLQDIGGEIISALPSAKLLPVAKTTAISSSGLTVADKKVLAVDKSDVRAKPIPAHEKAKYNDTASIYAATDTDPVYYIEDEKVYVNGAAGSVENSGHLHYVPLLPTSDGSTLTVHGDSAVANFPLEAQQLMVLGSAVRCLQRLLANATSSLPSDISGSLTFAGPPDPPSLSDTSISFSATVPVYTAPTVGGATEELTATIDAATAGEATDKYDFSRWFDLAADYIEDEEDVELANAQLQKIQTYIQTYSTQMQDNLNDFQKEKAEYDTKLQEAIQQAQINAAKAQAQAQIDASKVTSQAQIDAADAQQEAALLLQKENQEYAAKLQQFSSDLGKYSAEVQAKVQDHTAQIAEISAEIQKDSTEYNWISQRYAALKGQYDQAFGLMAPKEGQD